jgi:transglutaminase-like putative cysteine protease
MKLQISHDTVYDYSPAVETAQHMLYLTPLDSSTQQLLYHRIELDPQPANIRVIKDVYGNSRSFFSLQVAHLQLRVQAISLVLTQPSHLPASTISWEAARERFRYSASASFDAANEFVFASPMVPRQGEFAQYARASFAAGVSLLEAAIDLMHRIHREFSYESQSTEVNTPCLACPESTQRRLPGLCPHFCRLPAIAWTGGTLCQRLLADIARTWDRSS